MAYILGTDIGEINTREDVERQRANWQKHRDYLESVQEHMPRSTYEFATAPWHYDTSHARSLHDSWVDSLTIRESVEGTATRSDRLKLRFDCRGRTTMVKPS